MESVVRDSRVPQLDGLRGVAIALVMMQHFAPPGVGGPIGDVLHAGRIGVDLFFVLSGFLITGICLDHREGSFFLAFYSRRVLRIFPAYFAFLAVVGFASLYASGGVPRGFGWAAAFLANVPEARTGQINALSPSILHLWSVSVEEQFYLVWPACVVLLPRRVAAAAAVAAIPLAAAIRYALMARSGNDVAATVLMPARMDQLAMGALLAYSVRADIWSRLQPLLSRPSSLRAAASWLTLILIACWFTTTSIHADPLVGALRFSAIGAVFVALLAVVLSTPRTRPLARITSARGLRWLGTRSYATYLFHVPIAAIILSLAPRSSLYTLLALGGIALTFVLAEISWRMIERPALSLRPALANDPRHRAVTGRSPTAN